MSGPIAVAFSIWEYVSGNKTEGWVFFVVGMLLIFAACDLAWQDEHRNAQVLISEKSMLTNDINFWKQQSYQKDDALRQRDSLLVQNSTVLGQTQSSLASLSNRILDVSKPEKLNITDHFLGGVDSQVNPNIKAKYHGTWIVLTNMTITPIRLLVTCRADIVQVSGSVLGTGAMLGGGWGGRVTTSKKQYGVGILSPAWTPTNPMIVTVFTDNKDLGICTFEEK